MNIETSGLGALSILVLMAVVALATRWGGVYIMSIAPIGYRLKQFIQAMSGSVLIALVTPMAVKGDLGAQLALLTTAVVMIIVKKPLPAIACGMLVAALLRNF